ncbi:MAG: BspA family leucine-rich repeat surface protein, partial [Clostridia bacterium]|nr:BspA family leucine-rich repeat surface protein [Clostridia bacterium]
MVEKNIKGITLIALVITIIVLLILAGISINVLTGQNGILNKANKAKEEMKKAEYLEELRVIGLGLQPDRTTKNWDNQTYMNQYKKEIEDDDMFNEAKEIKFLENTPKITIQVITVEGWVYWVTEDNVEYKGTEDEQQPIEPEEPIVVEPTGIWASLEGNTLKFYTTEANAKAGGGKVYENVQGKTFIRDNTDGVEAPNTPWFADRDQIIAVEFVDEVAPEYLAYYFSDLTSLETVNMEKVKTINVTDMYGLFLNCRNLKEINTKGFDTRNVENMGWMFLNCSSLSNLELTMFNTKKVTNMEVMFNGCSGLTQLDVSSFDTSNVTTMRSMFANCSKLTQINGSNFDTTNVTNMATMFYNCSSLTALDVSSFDTS